jgi:multidrug efflux system membrane fusion protein
LGTEVKAAGQKGKSGHGRTISLAIIIVAAAAALYALHESNIHPTTSDSSLDADVVHVAAAVGGRILELPVTENARVAKGDLLFQIDPYPYRLAVEQSTAELAVATSNAGVAADQTKSAQENHDLAARTLERLRPLAANGYVPQQQLDQAQVSERDTATKLVQAQESKAAADASVRARTAALGIAQRQLDDTTVRATHDGLVVGLTISTGEMVAPSQSLFTLINTEEWFAEGDFRETDLRAIKIGDCATVFSMIDRDVPVKGVVQGIGWGVTDQDRINIPRSVPYVERSLNWVRVAQRFPVRVRLENPPPELMRLGASAVIEVKHGRACR